MAFETSRDIVRIATALPSEAATPAEKAWTPRVWAVTRMALAGVFLWAFLDKLLGLGFSTPPARAWLAGASPTTGFLSGSTGPFAPLYKGLAGNLAVDVLFMGGLLLIGLALLLGIGMRIAALGGVLMMALMWTARPPTTNPFLDDHVVYALVLVGLALGHAGRTWGLGAWWAARSWVRRHPFLA
jgi:thiosulfate dehydrogenase [quinone] large subunit